MLVIEDGKIISASADGNVTVLVVTIDDLNPATFEVPVRSVTREEFSRQLTHPLTAVLNTIA